MATYVMLTKLSAEAVKDPRSIEQLGKDVTQKLKVQVPQVNWLASYSILGPYDYLDIFEAPDERSASQAALIVRTFGHATTETWTAIPWDRFLGLVKEIS
ncbi:MAG TPA: GYD domain-containing protein [Dehalococcoidia bacterium]|nr:GYD domain-containing protein [Dehalococcoidia bacterium]